MSLEIDQATLETIAKVVGVAVGSAVTAGVVAWRARGRKDLLTPYQPGNMDEQPRVITRKEWHDIVNPVNTIPGLSRRIRELEDWRKRFEKRFEEHLEVAREYMATVSELKIEFRNHQERWEEVGVDAKEHRQRLEAHLLRIEEKLDRK